MPTAIEDSMTRRQTTIADNEHFLEPLRCISSKFNSKFARHTRRNFIVELIHLFIR